MPEVKIPQLNKTLSLKKGENLFQALRANELPIASSCGGEAVCGKCVIQVTQTALPLTAPNEDEKRLIDSLELPKNVRICCQLAVHSDIEIKTDYW